MTAKTMHIGADVQGIIRLLEDIPYEKRDLKWAEERTKFEELKKAGIKVVSSCPTPMQKSPGVWVCPGHPITDPKRLAEFEAKLKGKS